ncbi:MAG TPA: tape measure domain-containing protein [Pseudomonas sp.]|nr:tape measure domain-containing protein [Pseudomonas sp.]MBB51193.1 tape measure domain-containing protein [Pseudomonadales bacterium]MBB52289.1 tape measure domain-containing protein [Pseudomonadales bacterium]HCA24850.1 tape measure domain-containing protein [Pseudomonas sp.]|tara:strand:+ start:9822 stop:13115 length:3294 start_codon:yes stop_codon:yes gene_type:complete
MAGIKDRLIQFILRGKDEMSPEARKVSKALEDVQSKSQGLRDEFDKAKSAQGLATAFRTTSDAADRVRSTLERTEKRAAELRDELERNAGSKGLQISLRETEKEASRAARQLDKLTAEAQALEKAAKDAGVDTSKLADEERRLAADVDEAKRALKDNTTELRDLERQQRSATRSADEYQRTVQGVRTGVSDATIRFGKWLVSIYLVDKALQGLGAGVGYLRDGILSMLSTGDQFEGMQTQLTALMGSIEGGEQATEWIKKFTRDTPLQLQDVTEAFTLLKAFGLDPMDGTLQAITDQSEKLGGGMEKLTGISSALGQAWAKQKLQGEEILQLVERGVPVWDLLEKVTGKNTEQLQSLSSAGKLGRDVISDLIKEIGAAADGSAAANMTRLTGIVSNLRDVAGDFLDRIAKSGALDYVKRQLLGVADAIDQMDKDGRLDRLAASLSDAFIQASEWLKRFVTDVAEVDFGNLADKAGDWLGDFGAKLDDARMRVELFIAPFTTLFHGLVAGFATVGLAAISLAKAVVDPFLAAGQAIADAFGLDALKERISGARAEITNLQGALVDQIAQSGESIRNAWDVTTRHQVQGAREVTQAVKSETDQQRMMNQALADEMVIAQQVMKSAAIDAAIAGTQAIVDFAEAQKLIDTATTVEQLQGLRTAMLRAYQDGAITQQEYAAGLGIVADKLDEVGGEAEITAKSLSDVIDELEDFAGVQKAISNAKTDVDISKLRTAISKLYEDGKLTVDQYNKAIKDLEKQQDKLTDSTGTQADAQSNLEKQLQSVTDALAEQAAAEQAAADARAEQQAVFRDAFSTFFDEVVTAARTPLAELSDKALEAFDSLKGISSVDVDLDTSSLEGTAASLAIVRDSLAGLQADLDDQFRGPFARWADETMYASRQLQQQFLEQKLQLQQLMDSYDKGAITLSSFQVQALGLKSSLDLLDASDFSELDSALASVRQQFESVADSAKGTLASIRDELDKVRGNEEAIERRRMQSRQAELQAQIAEAQAAGNQAAVADLRQALGMLRSIQSETELARQTEARQQRRDAVAAAAPEAAPSPSKIIRLESAQGRSVDVSVPAGQEGDLLGILEQAGLRSL